MISIFPIQNIPLIEKGDDIIKIILNSNFPIENNDIIVIAQKVISKIEDRIVFLDTICPSKNAISLSKKTGRDARFCELILRESKEILEIKGKNILVRHKNGMICTSAGIDKSNLSHNKNNNKVVLLPINSDKTAKKIRESIEKKLNKKIAVIISDSLGSPDRKGAIGKAIGFSGIKGVIQNKTKDCYGNPISPTINIVDRITCAASVLMGESNEKQPIIIVRGVNYTRDLQSSLKDILE